MSSGRVSLDHRVWVSVAFFENFESVCVPKYTAVTKTTSESYVLVLVVVNRSLRTATGRGSGP